MQNIFLWIFEFPAGQHILWNCKNRQHWRRYRKQTLGARSPIFFFNIQIHLSIFPSHITVPNYLFILTARIFFLARVIGPLSKHENSSTLRAVLKSVAPVWTLLSVLIQTRNNSKTKKNKIFVPFTFCNLSALWISRNFEDRTINEHSLCRSASEVQLHLVVLWICPKFFIV